MFFWLWIVYFLRSVLLIKTYGQHVDASEEGWRIATSLETEIN